MKAKLFSAITAGTVLFAVGCSNGLTTSQGKAGTSSQTEKSALKESTSNQAADEMETASRTEAQNANQVAEEKSELLTTIDVRLAGDKMTLDHDKAEAGPVSFDIRNETNDPLDVVLLKTNLPVNEIPITNGQVDFTNSTVERVGHLATSPMATGGQETITRDLRPGNYVLMSYIPGKIDMAHKQVITVREPGI
jgi:hypothetical protein